MQRCDGTIEPLELNSTLGRLIEQARRGEPGARQSIKKIEREEDVRFFHVGELIEIKGWTYRIRKITKKDIVLRHVNLKDDEEE